MESKENLVVLIVDDIFANRLLLKEVISSLGHKYVDVENGKEALDALSMSEIDLIFMDIEMPVMNGIETVQNIRKLANPKLANIPVIALTAHNPLLFFKDFGDVGFDELMTKPYSIQKIKVLIDEVVLKKASTKN